MNNPIKHHYIPKLILKRFADSSGKLHSYNKSLRKINKKNFSPSAICYEENLHTIVAKNKFFYDIEKFYSKIETEFNKFIEKVELCMEQGVSPEDIPQTPEFLYVLQFFLVLSFWRLPCNTKIANLARKDLRRLYDSSSMEARNLLGLDRRLIKDIEKKSKHVSQKIVQFIILPILTSRMNGGILKSCKFYSTDFNLITSDNPVICTINPKNYSIENEDIYIPLGSRLCITNNIKNIDNFQKIIFSRADKIVIGCEDEMFLRFIR